MSVCEQGREFTDLRGELVLDTKRWLDSRLAYCRTRFYLASPFIGMTAAKLFETAKVDRMCLTTLRLGGQVNRATDPTALKTMYAMRVKLLQAPELHAKVYLVDNPALVTSANATWSGLTKNHECGIAVESAQVCDALVALLQSGFGAPDGAHRLTLAALATHAALVSKALRPSAQLDPVQPDQPSPELLVDPEILRRAFTSGWTKLTLEAVLELPKQFTIQDIYARGEPAATAAYPTNYHPLDKLRQQLQILRDHGLVDFLEPGKYERTFLLPSELP